MAASPTRERPRVARQIGIESVEIGIPRPVRSRSVARHQHREHQA
jgi:hypothetical protein